MDKNKQGNISERPCGSRVSYGAEKCGFVRIFIEGDDITINENVTANQNILSYINSIKEQVFKNVTIKIKLIIIDKNISYQI